MMIATAFPKPLQLILIAIKINLHPPLQSPYCRCILFIVTKLWRLLLPLMSPYFTLFLLKIYLHLPLHNLYCQHIFHLNAFFVIFCLASIEWNRFAEIALIDFLQRSACNLQSTWPLFEWKHLCGFFCDKHINAMKHVRDTQLRGCV